MKNPLIGTLLCAGLLAAVHVQAEEGVSRVLDRGRDGNVHYYEVVCDDATRGTVTVIDEPAEACAQGADSEIRCDANWTIRDAAIQACR